MVVLQVVVDRGRFVSIRHPLPMRSDALKEMAGREPARQPVMTDRSQSEGGDASALLTVRIAAELARRHFCFQVRGDGVGRLRKKHTLPDYGAGWQFRG